MKYRLTHEKSLKKYLVSTLSPVAFEFLSSSSGSFNQPLQHSKLPLNNLSECWHLMSFFF